MDGCQCLSRERGGSCCRHHASLPPCLARASVSPLILPPSVHHVRIRVQTGSTKAERGAEGAQRVCSQPPPLWRACGGTSDTPVPRSPGRGEQHAPEEPFHPNTPPQQAELPALRLSHPASTRLAPAPTAQHSGHLGSSSMLPALLVPNLSLPPSSAVHGAAQPHSTAAAGAGVLPCRRRRLLLRDCLYPSASPGCWDTGGCFAQPRSSPARLLPCSGNVPFSLSVWYKRRGLPARPQPGVKAAAKDGEVASPRREQPGKAGLSAPAVCCLGTGPKAAPLCKAGGVPQAGAPGAQVPGGCTRGQVCAGKGWAPLPSRALLRASPSLRARREGRTEAEEPASLSHFLCRARCFHG